MKKATIPVLLLALMPLLALARFVHTYDMRTLIAKSELVFVGRVRSVAESGIRTRLSYPTWRDAEFEWLIAEIDVLQPIKGIETGNVVRTAMLAVVGTTTPHGNLRNGPGILNPKVGDQYLLCLLPTAETNLHAAFTAPYDEHFSILPLDRDHENYRLFGGRDGIESEFDSCRDTVWNLVDEKGNIRSAGAKLMRETYHVEIGMAPSNNAVIHLQWETYRSAKGWETDAPKGYGNATNAAKNTKTQNTEVQPTK